MTQHARDEARADLVTYHKAMLAGLTSKAIAIEQKYDLLGYPPRVVSIGLAAAAEGRDHMEAVEAHIVGSD